MSNHTTKMAQVSMVSLHFLKSGIVEHLKSLHNVADVENLLIQI